MKATFEDLVNAYTIYRKITRSPANKNTLRRYFKFLGLGDTADWAAAVGAFGDEVDRKLTWMNGPHAKALYKAWQARHPDDDTFSRKKVRTHVRRY